MIVACDPFSFTGAAEVTLLSSHSGSILRAMDCRKHLQQSLPKLDMLSWPICGSLRGCLACVPVQQGLELAFFLFNDAHGERSSWGSS